MSVAVPITPFASEARPGRAWYLRWILPQEVAALVVPAILYHAGLPRLLAAILALLWSLALLQPTFRRLEDAGQSGWLVAISFLQFRLGPSWDGLGFVPLYLSQVIYLIPTVLACSLPTKVRDHPAETARSV